jgi:hypothetical protein
MNLGELLAGGDPVSLAQPIFMTPGSGLSLSTRRPPGSGGRLVPTQDTREPGFAFKRHREQIEKVV